MEHSQTKGFEFEFKTITEEGEFDGHASTFGNKDQGDDIVAEGAFTKDLKRTKGKVPILADHNIREHIGYNKKAEEVKKGLFVEGKLDLNVQRAREKHSLAKMAKELDVKMGLSIGYEVVKKSFDGPVRILEEIKFYEYSFTAFPMNVRAAVGNMKDFMVNVEDPFNSVLIAISEVGGEVSGEQLEKMSTAVVELMGKHKPEPKDIKDGVPVIRLPEGIFTSPREMERALREAGGFSRSRAKAVASKAFAGLCEAGNDEAEIKQLITFIKGLDFLPY